MGIADVPQAADVVRHHEAGWPLLTKHRRPGQVVDMRVVDGLLALRWVLYLVVLAVSVRLLWPDVGSPLTDDGGDPEGGVVDAIGYLLASSAILSGVAVVVTFGELAAFLRRESARRREHVTCRDS